MSTLSRRNFFTSVAVAAAAVPAVAVPAPALPAVGIPATAEEELIILETKIMDAAREAESSGGAHDRAEETEFDWRKCNPMPEEDAAAAVWMERQSAMKAACGLDEAEDKFSADCGALSDLAQKIADVPATTVGAIKIKRRIIVKQKFRFVGLDDGGVIAASIERDLRRMHDAPPFQRAVEA